MKSPARTDNQKKYAKSAKGLATGKRYRQSTKGRATISVKNRRYQQTENGSEAHRKSNKIYSQTENGRNRTARSEIKRRHGELPQVIVDLMVVLAALRRTIKTSEEHENA